VYSPQIVGPEKVRSPGERFDVGKTFTGQERDDLFGEAGLPARVGIFWHFYDCFPSRSTPKVPINVHGKREKLGYPVFDIKQGEAQAAPGLGDVGHGGATCAELSFRRSVDPQC
jgi:hypothetical protein